MFREHYSSLHQGEKQPDTINYLFTYKKCIKTFICTKIFICVNILIRLLIILFLFLLCIDTQQLFFIGAQQSYIGVQQRILYKGWYS